MQQEQLRQWAFEKQPAPVISANLPRIRARRSYTSPMQTIGMGGEEPCFFKLVALSQKDGTAMVHQWDYENGEVWNSTPVIQKPTFEEAVAWINSELDV